MKNFWGQKNEGRKDVPGADALQGVHRRGLQDEQGQVCQSSHAEPLELFPGWLGDEGGDVSELTEASLEAMLIKIRKHMDETGNRVSLIPKYFIVRPADLEALGLTVDEVTKMIKEQNT
jgi:hypothetical protein